MNQAERDTAAWKGLYTNKNRQNNSNGRNYNNNNNNNYNRGRKRNNNDNFGGPPRKQQKTRAVTNINSFSINDVFNAEDFNKEMEKISQPSIFFQPEGGGEHYKFNVFTKFENLILEHLNFSQDSDRKILKRKCINHVEIYSHKFFLSTNLEFFRRIRFYNIFEIHTNEWQVPEGILQSLKGPSFNLIFQVFSG